MSEAELARLPPLAQEIINLDRQLEEMRRQPALPLFAFLSVREDAKRLRAAAAQNWGPRLGADDNKTRG